MWHGTKTQQTNPRFFVPMDLRPIRRLGLAMLEQAQKDLLSKKRGRADDALYWLNEGDARYSLGLLASFLGVRASSLRREVGDRVPGFECRGVLQILHRKAAAPAPRIPAPDRVAAVSARPGPHAQEAV